MTKRVAPEMRKTSRTSDVVAWTEQRLAILRRMWRDSGSTCPQIADAIGGGATRNAVIGKARRLELGPKPCNHEEARARGAATKLAKSERQRSVSTQALIARDWCNKPALLSGRALADRRAKQTAAGKAFIAKVELALVENPAFVEVEKPWDPYAHMRSDKGYSDAVAALTR